MRKLINNPIFTNVFWLFLDKGYGAILTLYIYSQLAIYFGTSLFGVWNYIISFSTIIVGISSLGLNFVIVKRVKKNPILAKQILSNAFYLRLIAGVAVALVLFCIYYLIGVNYNKDSIGVIILIFSSQIVLNANVIIFWNEANLNNKWTVIARNLALTISFSCKLLAINYSLDIIYFALFNLIEFTLFFVFILIITKNSCNLIKSFKIDKKVAFPLIKDGLPLLMAAVTVTLYLKIDQLIIGYLLNNSKVGVYASASRLAEMLYIIPVVISNVFFPKIMGFVKQKRTKKMKELLNILFGLTFGITIIISLITSLFSENIISFVYGEKYIEAADVLKAYAWSILFMGLLVSSSKYLLAINRNDIIFKRELLGLLTNVILNLILIPKFGLKGAAWATLISYFIASFLSNLFFKQLRPLMKDQVLSVFYLFKRVIWKIK